MAPFILKLAVVAVHIVEIFSFVHRKENPSINNGRCGSNLLKPLRTVCLSMSIFSQNSCTLDTFCKNSDIELQENLKNCLVSDTRSQAEMRWDIHVGHTIYFVKNARKIQLKTEHCSKLGNSKNY